MDSPSNPSQEKPFRPKKARPESKVINSMRDMVEINACGTYCRMPRCRFVQRVFRSSNFYEHFRKDHPEEAQRRGLLKNSNLSVAEQTRKILDSLSTTRPQPKLPLKQLVLEYISMDEAGVHCELTSDEPKCTYVQQKFNHPNFARHFCQMHPFEASQKGFCRGFLEGVLEKKALKSSLKEALARRSKTPKAIFDFAVRAENGWYCRIAGRSCPFVRSVFVTETFRRHFRLKHPREAKEYGFFEALSQTKIAKKRGMVWMQKQRSDIYRENERIDDIYRENERIEMNVQSGENFDTEHEEHLEQKPPSKDPSKYCRFCFTVTEYLEPIFNRPDDNDLPALITSCTNVLLNPDEDHLSSICGGCRQKLHQIQRFQYHCQRLNVIVVRERDEAKRPSPIEDTPAADEPTTFLVEMIKPEPVECTVEETRIEKERPAVEEDTAEELPYSQLWNGWFSCRLCNRTAHARDDMIAHLRNEHEQATPTVPASSTGEHDGESFGVVKVGDVPYYKCTDCDTLMRLRSNILRHWRRYHSDSDQQDKRIYCTESGCGQFFMEYRGHKNHLEFFHGIRLVDFKAKD